MHPVSLVHRAWSVNEIPVPFHCTLAAVEKLFIVNFPFLQVVLPFDFLVYNVILHLRHSKSAQLPIHLSEVDRE